VRRGLAACADALKGASCQAQPKLAGAAAADKQGCMLRSRLRANSSDMAVFVCNFTAMQDAAGATSAQTY
jgi:hypothetical protein